MNVEHPMYGRLRTNAARIGSDDSARDFFNDTLLPMFFAGLVYKIILYNNEENKQPDFDKTIDINFEDIPEERHNPLRVSLTYPVEIDSRGILRGLTETESGERNTSDGGPPSSMNRLRLLITNRMDHVKRIQGGYRSNRSTHRKKRTNRRKTRR
jgi:hypothetical protein